MGAGRAAGRPCHAVAGAGRHRPGPRKRTGPPPWQRMGLRPGTPHRGRNLRRTRHASQRLSDGAVLRHGPGLPARLSRGARCHLRARGHPRQRVPACLGPDLELRARLQEAGRRLRRDRRARDAYLTDRGIGAGWECGRGHVAQAGACVPIVIPENAYATNAGYGAASLCERGFVQADGRCEPVTVPARACPDDRTYGPGWRCARGYEARKTSCVTIDLPENAHLDRSGNRWQCTRGFQVSEGGRCRQTR